MRPNAGSLQMAGRRIVLAAVAAVAGVAGLQLSGVFALAALDGGQELPAWAFYGVPVLAAMFLPMLPMKLGMFPKGRWHGTTVGLGAAIGAGAALATGLQFARPVLWLLGLPALGALIGTFGWMPGAGLAATHVDQKG
jgi:hypothetical protein